MGDAEEDGPELGEGGVELFGRVIRGEGVRWGEGHEDVGDEEGEDGAQW